MQVFSATQFEIWQTLSMCENRLFDIAESVGGQGYANLSRSVFELAYRIAFLKDDHDPLRFIEYGYQTALEKGLSPLEVL